MRPALARWAGSLLLLAVPASARADSLFGYQLGFTQSLGTVISDNAQNFVVAGADTTTGTTQTQLVSAPVQRLTGVQSDTAVTGNVTYDIVSQGFEQAMLAGLAFDQLIPLGVPDDANGSLKLPLTGVTANASYLARYRRPLWSIAAGAAYGLASNGRLANNPDGSPAATDANTTLPGARLGAFALNTTTHTVNARTDLQLTRLDWDLDFLTVYTYTLGGLFTLAAGPPGSASSATTPSSSLGAFVPATTHVLSPSLTYRHRFQRRHLFEAIARLDLTIPALDNTPITVTGMGISAVVPQTQIIPPTAITTANLIYLYSLNDVRRIGGELIGILSYRTPTTVTPGETVFAGTTDRPAGLSADALIVEARGRYFDHVQSLDLFITLSAGVAQARLFQQPLGFVSASPLMVRPCMPGETASGRDTRTGMDACFFIPPISDSAFILATPSVAQLQPVVELSLLRRFDPVDLALVGTRQVGVGALGASAVTTESVALTALYRKTINNDRNLLITVGGTASRTRGVDQSLLPDSASGNGVLPALDNDSIGATAAIDVPIFRAGELATDAQLAYAFGYSNPDPGHVLPKFGCTVGNCLGQDPVSTHTALFTLRAIFGRGPLQAAVRGAAETAELDAFTRNPQSGSPLTSARLMNQGARLGGSQGLLDGTSGAAPGLPAAQRRDSREAFQQGIRQQLIEQESRTRANAVSGNGTLQQDEAAAEAAAKKEREQKREKRTRTFEEWPQGTALPTGDRAGSGSEKIERPDSEKTPPAVEEPKDDESEPLELPKDDEPPPPPKKKKPKKP